MATLRVGPIVGLVERGRARILFETDAAAAVSWRLRRDNYDVAGGQIQGRDRRPTVLEVNGVEPGERYQVALEVDNREHTAGFDVPDGRELTIAVVSCNDGEEPEAAGLWDRLRGIVSDRQALIAHCGDQIYADGRGGNLLEHWTHELHDLDPGQWPAYRGTIAEAYRELYRSCWSRPAQRAAMAAAPNLMIWDDHEIADDFGDRSAFYRPGPERFISEIGWDVYREYQRALWTDAVPAARDGEDYSQSWGPIGILFTDQRGGRAFRAYPRRHTAVPINDPYLGPAQWGRIRGFLDRAELEVMIAVTPVPLVYLGPRATDYYDGGPGGKDDLWGHWAHEPHRAEQRRMLAALEAWKREKPGRLVAVLGGDVHHSSITRICRRRTTGFGWRDEFLCNQLVASPIGHTPACGTLETPSAVKAMLLSSGLKAEKLLFPQEGEPGYSYDHDEDKLSAYRRNFGLVRVRKNDTGAWVTEMTIEAE